MTEPLNVLHKVVRARVAGLALAGLLPILGLARVNALQNAQAPEIGQRQLQSLPGVFARDVLGRLARLVLFLHAFLLPVYHSVCLTLGLIKNFFNFE